MAQPTWAGSIQISLVSIAVKIFPASNPGRRVEFHQIDRKSHQRIHHKNIDEGGAVEKADIVKGFKYAKNKYIEIDPEELKALRLETATVMQIKQFVKGNELPSELFDRTYFVAPRMSYKRRRSTSCKRRYRRPRPLESGRSTSAVESIWWRSALRSTQNKRD